MSDMEPQVATEGPPPDPGIISELGFAERHWVKGRSSVADIYPASRDRCGIYVLGFANDQWYCGQAVDVARRFVQHTKNHPDIVSIRFRPFPREELNEREREHIRRLEAASLPLRNIVHVSVVQGETDFDQIMPVADQDRWRHDLNWADESGPRMDDSGLRRGHAQAYARFRAMEDSTSIIAALRTYMRRTIPAIRRSELVFWRVSCLPDTMTLVRVNVYLQEVMNILKTPSGVCVTLYLARSVLRQEYGRMLWGLRRVAGWLAPSSGYYPSGGADQMSLRMSGLNRFHSLMQEPGVLRGCRAFNLNLMRKGPGLNQKSHCFQLADEIVP